ncbi:MAG: acyl-CoA thioesterase [Kiritimatiellae bacterium]|jgi:acyl-CoA hydrolase|nr:acyl-CoA thioesterase [Kiritimatiellia bacterium]NLD90325.1 acyl-CoA thioesterase [Lentisphaerota bacterium]HOU21728.1 acyl-CoA thioesterase [Kiritimatiellia bacterium]HPC19893.1 acyl-CoA thioesterase [Kiritimatiellia bacterium]HQQ59800.1 acyl-CoA thioesterase [Kiritimatiellia bacterium]
MTSPETPRRPHEITLRFVTEPADENLYGKVHGGAVMKWIDQAGYACATGWCGQACVTVYVGGIRFYQPILVGHLVEVRARLIHTGRTSMHIAVDVLSRDLRTQAAVATTHCVIVFVALDAEGQPAPVPAWQPQTDADRALEDYAKRRLALSQSLALERPPALAEE